MLNNDKLLADLYSENRERIAIYIKSKIYSKEQADVYDCVQEVFLIAFKKSLETNLGEHPNIKGWLFKVAQNVALKFNTSYMKARENLEIEQDMSLIPDSNSPINQLIEDIAFDEIDIEKFRADLTEILTENENDLFDMKFVGKTNKEISVVLNISENAVKQKYKRIRQKLKSHYEKVTPL